MNAVEKVEPQAAEGTTLLSVISRAASDPNVDIEKMERLMAMHERMLAQQAVVAFNESLSDMQSELPSVGERGGIKDRNGNVQSTYALWEDINQAIKPVLQKHGFALSFRTDCAEGISVTAVLSHKGGHREETTIKLPADATGSKNAVQSVGSSTSYGKRYTAGALLNLRTGDIDDDGASGGKPTLSEEQVANLDTLLTEIGGDAKARYLRYAKVQSLDQILAANYSDAVRVIEKRRSAA